MIVSFWGLPRTGSSLPQAGQRGTYMFVSGYSLYSEDDAFKADGLSADTWYYRQMKNAVIEAENKLNEFQRTGDNASYNAYKNYYEKEARSNAFSQWFPGNGLFPAWETARKDVADRVREANLTRQTPRSQPLMLLHQTNRLFEDRKVFHAQVAIRPDLMLSEVIYEKHDGQNYTLLEVYNTSTAPVDLSEYGVVRLIPATGGGHLAFRSPSGQPVESLEQALVLPLTALKSKGQTSPFVGSKLPATLQPTGYSYADGDRRVSSIFSTTARGGLTRESGSWQGRWTVFELTDDKAPQGLNFYMLPGQSILLGASGYINKPVTNSGAIYEPQLLSGSSWFATLFAQMKRNLLGDETVAGGKANQYRLRYAYAYADGQAQAGNAFGEGTLDYRPGDAFALVKRTDTGWQIIDATGPVGAKELAFAGTYADFRSTFTPLANVSSFSQQRMDGVNYPFIAPYRTKKLTTHWADDWSIIQQAGSYTPGRRFDYGGMPYIWSSALLLTKRTPLDMSFTAYQNARPTRGY